MLQRLNSEPKRILMSVDAVGGVWRYAMDLAGAMRPGGAQFLFVGMGPGPSAAQRAEAEALGELVWLDLPLDWTTDDEMALDAIAPALEALSVHADVIHLNAPSQAAGLKANIPVITASHSCVVTWFAAVKGTQCPPQWSWQHRRNLAGMLASNAVIVPSRSHGETLSACYGPIENLHVVHNSTQPAAPGAEKRDVVMAAGRWWDEGKNAALLSAIARDIDWPIIAAGQQRSPDGKLVDMNGVAATGPLSGQETRERIAQAGIVVSPSLYEPFGLVALEAAMAATPLVLSDIPTYRELWDGAALFAPPNSPSHFIEAVNKLARDPKLRREMGARAQRRAEHFTPQRQADAMHTLYREAAAQHSR